MTTIEYLLANKVSYKEINEAQRIFDAPYNEADICLEDNAIILLLKVSEHILGMLSKETNEEGRIARLAAIMAIFFLSGMVAEIRRHESE
jgi:hypothetical protein